ncbi:MAG TPA: hypothetical protein VII94_05870 [Candidatus Saccharimonadales bacterium]
MSLKLLQPGTQPLGQFDGLDSDVLTLKGGEVVSFTSVTVSGQPGVTTSGQDQAAYDAFDGYVNVSGTKRAAVTRLWDGTHLPSDGYTVVSGVASGRPLMLADEGITGYGTLFGTVVGGTVGQQVNGPNSVTGVVLGPQTATGSGKVTCWDKPGLYAVSLDNTDGYLQPTSSGVYVGQKLGFTSLGLLTQSGSVNDITHGTVSVAHFVEFNTNGSLVTTPNYLVAALNSPSGNVSSVQNRQFSFATISFAPPTS